MNAAQKKILQTCNLSLKYSYEEPPGITRVKRGKGFAFLCPEGSVIKNPKEKQRLKSIAVPPTYEGVWYCPLPNGHLQATGFDSTNKKQYFYHLDWEKIRDQSKFSRMLDFAECLPSLRRKISKEISHSEELSKEQVLSVMTRILDKTGMRVGNETASNDHETYGLTTLQKCHFSDDDGALHFEFDGKGGAHQEQEFCDSRLSKIIDDCAEIPGQRLFQYIDESGQTHKIHSGDLNAYLKARMGTEFSAKDFRTWRFSSYFLDEALRQHDREDKTTLTSVLDAVSEKSGNTPAILKSSYVHPGLLMAVKDGDWKVLQSKKEEKAGLLKSENHLLNYLNTKHARDALVGGNE